MGSRRKSYLWNFFVPGQNGLGKCNMCNKNVSFKSSTTNLRKHIERKHPNALSKEENTPALRSQKNTSATPVTRRSTRQDLMDIEEAQASPSETSEGAAEDNLEPIAHYVIQLPTSENRKGEDDNDQWDDTELIRAYEAALDKTKRLISSEKKSNVKHSWKVGDHCRCQYSEDGLFYEAVITDIGDKECEVRYLGYDNVEKIQICNLKRSKGPKNRRLQIKEAAADTRMDVDSNEQESIQDDLPHITPTKSKENRKTSAGTSRDRMNIHAAMHPPPLMPPPLLQSDGRIPTSSEALNAMLMSWYMSGYHTGYYEGIMRSENKSK